MPGIVKSGFGTIVGNAGEYLVVGELLKRGLIATPAPRNAPGIDVMVTNRKKFASVRVKTKTNASDSWVWNRSKGENGVIFKDLEDQGDFTVLVDLRGPNESPEFYVIQTAYLNTLLRKDFDKWLRQPGKRGKPHSPDNRMHRYGGSQDNKELLKSHRSKWDQITNFLSAK